ncbi:hypothetical protein J8281_18325 [Aquimarina sp. U1-2]|uniref:DUF6973 domain-containing protein n=1 Tax=Aquimarina sp. U1-2 TaxID=2823141 RepID=UPI001AEC7ABA|nr:hypothetical protein [Aquimarina sp. U1-2]MBP2834160.1 hypothetical protein [Aquimarina sp. U1-2]
MSNFKVEVVLFCKVTYNVKKCEQKAVDWAKQVTDLHEDLSPNSELERAMDLHNNKIGRDLFVQFKDRSHLDLIHLVKQKTRTAVRVENSSDIKNFPDNLVHL